MTAGGRRLRILHVGKFYPPARGGMETHLQQLARAQAGRGHSVSVLCTAHADRAGRDVSEAALARTASREDADAGVRVHRLARWAQLGRFDVMPGFLPALARRALDADVVHVHTPHPPATLALTGLPVPAPIVVTHHSDIVRQRRLGRLFRPFELALHRRARAILATSARAVDASAVLSRSREKVRVVPLGIDLGPFLQPGPEVEREERALRSRAGSGPVWLSVGRLVAYKGLMQGLEAFARLPGRWWIAGEGPEGARVRAAAEAQGLSGRIDFLGAVSAARLAALYRVATALLFPSNARNEAFGLVQVEAMASGCPVLNFDVPGSAVPEVSPHDDAALTAPLGDASALARNARRLLDEPGLAQRLGDGGRRRAQERYALSRMVDHTLAIYDEVRG